MTTLRTGPDGNLGDPLSAPQETGERYGKQPLSLVTVLMIVALTALGLLGIWQVLVH